LPWVEYLYFKPKQDGGAGEYLNYLIGAPEVCLYLAEFTEKGYISGIVTAKEWYEKGVRNSCQNYDAHASKAQIGDFEERKITEAAITAMLASNGIKYGSNNVEKIILQEIINLYIIHMKALLFRGVQVILNVQAVFGHGSLTLYQVLN
jgi:hypothetical protein